MSDCFSVVECVLLAGLGKSAGTYGSGTLAACGHLIYLACLAGFLDAVDDFDGVEADIVVAADGVR